MRRRALARLLALPAVAALLWLPSLLLPAPTSDDAPTPAPDAPAQTEGFPGIRLEGCHGVLAYAEVPAEVVRSLVPDPLRPDATGVAAGTGLARLDVASYACERGLSPERVVGPVRALWTALRVNADDAADPAPGAHEYLLTLALSDAALARDATLLGLPARAGALGQGPGDLPLEARWTARGSDLDLDLRLVSNARDGFDAPGPATTWVGAPPQPLRREGSHTGDESGAQAGRLVAHGSHPLAAALHGLDVPVRTASLGLGHAQWTR